MDKILLVINGEIMENSYNNRIIEFFHDRNSGMQWSEFQFSNCHFIGSSVECNKSITENGLLNKIFINMGKRTAINNIEIINCEQTGCKLTGVIVQDVIVNGLKTHNIFQTWGSVYEHVVLKGKIGQLMISPLLFIIPTDKQIKIQIEFDKLNYEFYKKIDWALNIQEAIFTTPIDIRGVPAHLIIRDPISQAVVNIEKTRSEKWKDIDLSGTPWEAYLRYLINSKYDQDVILTAPKGASKSRYKKCLDGINKLRDIGIAEIY